MSQSRNAYHDRDALMITMAAVCWILTTYQCLKGNAGASEWVGGVVVWMALSGLIALSLVYHWVSRVIVDLFVLGGVVSALLECAISDQCPDIGGYAALVAWALLAVISHVRQSMLGKGGGRGTYGG